MSHPAPVITDIRARAVDAPLAQPIRTAVGTLSSAPLVLIDVETDQNIIGRAYLFGYTPVTLRPLVEMIAQLAPMLAGKTVAPVERMREFDRAFRLLGRQGLLGMAISGLDMAFWDILGGGRQPLGCPPPGRRGPADPRLRQPRRARSRA